MKFSRLAVGHKRRRLLGNQPYSYHSLFHFHSLFHDVR